MINSSQLTFVTQAPQRNSLENECAIIKSKIEQLDKNSKKSLSTYENDMQFQLERQETLRIRKIKLEQKHRMVQQFVKQQVLDAQSLKKENDLLAIDLVRLQSSLCRLTDNIAGATLLLKTLETRTAQYSPYLNFASQTYNVMNVAQAPVLKPALADSEISETGYTLKTIDFLQQMHGRISKQDSDFNAKMKDLNTLVNKTSNSAQEQNQLLKSELVITQNQLQKLHQQLEFFSKQKQVEEENFLAAQKQVHNETVEQAKIYASLRNLAEKAETFAEGRHNVQAENASYADMVGDVTYLEQMAKIYQQRSPVQLNIEECTKKFIGEGLDKKLRAVYKIGLIVADLDQLVQICTNQQQQ
ncbi:Conserved_hypothetical protein [Hexamita inflata]|uniref:Uncharacterized protein n=1 Tax=Hexamita inflata TaxID=28002 RepID=A0AA86PF89_9EUKA|nr:Conserved hypothetical protein [Hexamita inflata]